VSKLPAFRVIAPYRFNPLGAHIDHQGGAVLARTLDRHTLLLGKAIAQPELRLTACFGDQEHSCQASLGAIPDDADRWARYAFAAAHVMHQRHTLHCGLEARVTGSMIAAGLSSSASYLLAILTALAEANDLSLTPTQLVDGVREVEHQWLGLTNGLQDQLSIVHGQSGAISRLDVDAGCATHIADPAEAQQVCWLLCFSGVSRELVGSGFNTRVAECLEAAGLLHAGASRLGDVPEAGRSESALSQLPDHLARRARHVFTEMQRVDAGAAAWGRGDIAGFGELMNHSCQSSITQYESGSEWLVALHEIASSTPGVYGNRFSGGGYGGCLVMLADRARSAEIAAAVLDRYVSRYPDMGGKAHCFVAGEAGGVCVERLPEDGVL
jgi:galactokinase